MNSIKNCKKCELWKYRKNVVDGEGTFPSDILIIGEMFSRTEDLLGKPYSGEGGFILRTAIKEALSLSKGEASFYLTYVCACRTCDGAKLPSRTPTEDEAFACWPRLDKISRMVKPKTVIFLGKGAKQRCKQAFPAGELLTHPASLLRSGGVKSPMYRTMVRKLVDIINLV